MNRAKHRDAVSAEPTVPPQPFATVSSAIALLDEPTAAGLRVLVVDDSRLVQHLARAILERRGHSVSCADDGDSAVRQVGAVSFDVVLMDVQMPGMCGCQTATRLRQQGHGVPIIALTAGSAAEERQRCLDAGMNDYLAKPFRWSDLLSAVERWARS